MASTQEASRLAKFKSNTIPWAPLGDHILGTPSTLRILKNERKRRLAGNSLLDALFGVYLAAFLLPSVRPSVRLASFVEREREEQKRMEEERRKYTHVVFSLLFS